MVTNKKVKPVFINHGGFSISRLTDDVGFQVRVDYSASGISMPEEDLISFIRTFRDCDNICKAYFAMDGSIKWTLHESMRPPLVKQMLDAMIDYHSRYSISHKMFLVLSFMYYNFNGGSYIELAREKGYYLGDWEPSDVEL